MAKPACPCGWSPSAGYILFVRDWPNQPCPNCGKALTLTRADFVPKLIVDMRR